MSKAKGSGPITRTDDALQLLLSYIPAITRRETVGLEDADNRILGVDATASIDYPHYDQCIVDGYAVRAEDTRGCGTERALILRLSENGPVTGGTCRLVHTGSALPDGADAVVMREYAGACPDGISITQEAKPGEWIWPVGAGIPKGGVICPEGMQLKPTDIAMLMKTGIDRVEVYEKPRVLVIPTGDEIVGPGGILEPGTVYDSNGPMCCLLVRRFGGLPTMSAIVPDDPGRLKAALLDGTGYDLIVTIGGSSGGKRDLMEQTVSSAGKVLVHEIAFHPGNHSGAGYVEDGGKRTPVIFLPGYTESCAVAMFTLVRPAIAKLGRLPPSPEGRFTATLAQDTRKPPGIRKVIKVRVNDGKATPVKLIAESGVSGEYAYLVIPESVEGYRAGEHVECICLE